MPVMVTRTKLGPSGARDCSHFWTQIMEPVGPGPNPIRVLDLLDPAPYGLPFILVHNSFWTFLDLTRASAVNYQKGKTFDGGFFLS